MYNKCFIYFELLEYQFIAGQTATHVIPSSPFLSITPETTVHHATLQVTLYSVLHIVHTLYVS